MTRGNVAENDKICSVRSTDLFSLYPLSVIVDLYDYMRVLAANWAFNPQCLVVIQFAV